MLAGVDGDQVQNQGMLGGRKPKLGLNKTSYFRAGQSPCLVLNPQHLKGLPVWRTMEDGENTKAHTVDVTSLRLPFDS